MSTAVISFGRMSPPTIGHQKLVDKIISVAKQNKATPLLYLSHSFDSKKNPLTYDQKYNHAKKSFGSIVQKSKARTIIEVLKELDGKYDNMIVVVGGDRLQEFQNLLMKYNGKDYTFKTLDVMSAGDRDPDADDVSGMSASKLRQHVKDDNFNSFAKGMPRKLTRKDAEEIFNNLRKNMNLTEEELIEFVLNFQQRMKKRIIMRRLKNRIKRGRKIAQRKMANGEKLKGRSQKKARQMMRAKLAGSLGKNYANLPFSAKIQIDKKLEKRKAVIQRVAKRLLPRVRKAERERLASFRRKKQTKESVDLYLTMEMIMENVIFSKLEKKLQKYKTDPAVKNIIALIKSGKYPDKKLLNSIKKDKDDVALAFAEVLGPEKTYKLYNG